MILLLTPLGDVTNPLIGTISDLFDSSSELGKARIAKFLSLKTKLLPLGFHLIFTTLSPLCTSIYCGSAITQLPVGVQTKTRGIPVPITNYCECGANLNVLTGFSWIRTV